MLQSRLEIFWASVVMLAMSSVGLCVYKRRRKRTALLRLFRDLEKIIQQDEGHRGIKDLCIPHELGRAAQKLYKAKAVCIITGFPCLLRNSVPTETDGPPGALAIARACIKLGMQPVYILTDSCNVRVVYAAAADLLKSSQCQQLHIESFPETARWCTAEEARLREIAASVDAVIAIERAGPSISNGHYYTMRGVSMDHLVAPLEKIFGYTGAAGQKLLSIGIGDGGNEVGCGKIQGAILRSDISQAHLITCSVATDYLILSSISNLGGYALATALAVLAAEAGAYDGSCIKAVTSMVVTPSQERALVQRIVAAGAGDGVSGLCVDRIDGLSVRVSLDILSRLQERAMSYG